MENDSISIITYSKTRQFRVYRTFHLVVPAQIKRGVFLNSQHNLRRILLLGLFFAKMNAK